MSYPVSRTSVGWNISRSLVCSGQPKAEKVHNPAENQVSRVSASCFQPSSRGLSTPTYTSLFLYQAGTLWPYQICLEIFQSCRLLIQWKYTFSKRSGRIFIFPLLTASNISSLRVLLSLSFISLLTFINHCSLGRDSIIPPVRSAVATFCRISFPSIRRLFSLSHKTIFSLAETTFSPSSPGIGSSIFAYSLITWIDGRL